MLTNPMTTSSISHEIKYKNNLAKNMPDNDKGEKDNSNSIDQKDKYNPTAQKH